MFFVDKKGFTLVELLVVLSIIGVLSTSVFAAVRESIHVAQASYELQIGNAVLKAFELKALDDNIFNWWHEDDFPPSIGWGSYIEDIIEDDVISEFLPIIPNENDYGGNGTDLPYAYDNDGDTFSDPGDCFSISNQGRSFRGVNFVYNPGVNSSSRKWNDMVEYLDNAVDKGDGPFCGRLRYALTGSAGNRGQIIYAIDFDQKPNF